MAHDEVGQKCGAQSELKSKCKLITQFSYPMYSYFVGD